MVSDRINFRKVDFQVKGLRKRLEHKEAVFAVAVVFCQSLHDRITRIAIEALRRSVANPHFKNDRPDAANAKSFFDVR